MYMTIQLNVLIGVDDLKLKRIHEIEDYILKNDTVTLVELTEKFDVSMNTIRRDINYLEKSGVIKKVYGGVTSTSGKELTSFDFRLNKNQKAKEEIGKLASKLINENDLIFIDSGTTTNTILSYIDPNLNFTLLTNNLDVIISASDNPNIELVVIGHRYHHKTKSFLKMSTSSDISENYNISKAFMAVTGVSRKNGLTNSDFHEHEIKKMISDRAAELYVLADSSKFESSTLLTYAPLSRADKIITNTKLNSEIGDYCTSNNIEIVYPEQNQ